jgi:hypothetical protein
LASALTPVARPESTKMRGTSSASMLDGLRAER